MIAVFQSKPSLDATTTSENILRRSSIDAILFNCGPILFNCGSCFRGLFQ